MLTSVFFLGCTVCWGPEIYSHELSISYRALLFKKPISSPASACRSLMPGVGLAIGPHTLLTTVATRFISLKPN